MLKSNTKHLHRPCILFLMVAALSGCSYNGTVTSSKADNLKRQAIMNDKSLTPEQRDDKLGEIYDSEQPSPVVPIVAGLGLLGLVLMLRSAKQRKDEVDAERRLQKQKAAKIAEAKAAYEAAKAPRIVSKRQAQAEAAAAENGLDDAVIEMPAVRLPSSQTAVNALPLQERGMSFFTSRPIPKDALVEVTVMIGDRFRLVCATAEEADSVEVGRTPLIRAFTYRKKTLPWYEWAGYDPYRHYWAAVAHDWLWMGSKVTASWMGVERANPDLRGYLDGSKPTMKINWDRATRPRAPGSPAERVLFKCTNMARFLELRRRRPIKPSRSILRGKHIPPLAIPSRPLRLHKRPVKQPRVAASERHVFLEF